MNYTQLRLKIRVELNSGWSSPSDLWVDVPHQQLVELMSEPFLKDAIQRAEKAEATNTRLQQDMLRLRSRNWLQRLRNRP